MTEHQIRQWFIGIKDRDDTNEMLCLALEGLRARQEIVLLHMKHRQEIDEMIEQQDAWLNRRTLAEYIAEMEQAVTALKVLNQDPPRE